MNGRQWRKLCAGGGVVAMLLGVLMVVAPATAGAAHWTGTQTEFGDVENPQCSHLTTGTYVVQAKDDTGFDTPPFNNGVAPDANEDNQNDAVDANGNNLKVNYSVNEAGVVSFTVDSTSEYLVSAVIIKQAGSAIAYYYDPAALSDTGLEIPNEDDNFSHITFCGSAGSIDVDKIVDGDDAPDPATEFDFALSCTNNGNDIVLGDDSDFSLTDSSLAEVIDGLPVGSECTVTETEPTAPDAAAVNYVGTSSVCGDDEGGLAVTVTVEAAENIGCAFTNSYEEVDQSLTIVKVVDGATDWEVDFEVDGVTEIADFALTDEDDTSGPHDVAEGNYTITELLDDATPGDMVFVEAECTIPDGEGGTEVLSSTDATEVGDNDPAIAVSVGSDQDVTCTFTNEVPEEVDQSLTIVKVVDGATDWEVDFEVDGVTEIADFALTDEDDTSGPHDVAEGDYTITELLDDATPGDMVFVEAECTIPDGEGGTEVLSSTDATEVGDNDPAIAVSVGSDQDVTCTFTNEVPEEDDEIPPPPPGPTFSINIEKTNDANESGTFSNAEFADVDGEAVRFRIVISNTGTGDVTVSSLVDTFPGGSVDLLVDEVDLVCDNGFPTSLVIEDGEDVTCTFTIDDYAVAGSSITNIVTVDTNQRVSDSDSSQVITPEVAQEATGSITVMKEMGGDPLDDWEVGIDASGNGVSGITLTDDDETESWFGLDAGDYVFTEDVENMGDGVEFTSVSCVDDTDAPVGTDDGASVSVSLAAGQDVVCTFVNTYTAPTIDVAPAPEVTPTAPAVLGDVVTRPQALPRTGSESSGLAAAGAGLIAMGAALVLSSRMRFRRMS